MEMEVKEVLANLLNRACWLADEEHTLASLRIGMSRTEAVVQAAEERHFAGELALKAAELAAKPFEEKVRSAREEAWKASAHLRLTSAARLRHQRKLAASLTRRAKLLRHGRPTCPTAPVQLPAPKI